MRSSLIREKAFSYSLQQSVDFYSFFLERLHDCSALFPFLEIHKDGRPPCVAGGPPAYRINAGSSHWKQEARPDRHRLGILGGPRQRIHSKEKRQRQGLSGKIGGVPNLSRGR